MNRKNSEGYQDLTAAQAIDKADRIPENVSAAIRRMKTVAGWHGFEVSGRIWLKDPKTGREYR